MSGYSYYRSYALQTAYDQGRDAFKQCQPRTDNPYINPVYNFQSIEWLKGWDAEQQRMLKGQ